MALATRPKPKAHHKKRQGQHHRQTKHYAKAYWPYLPMLLVVGLGIVFNSVWSQSGVLGVKRDYSSVSLLEATNKQRTDQQETALSLDSQLTAAAQAKAADMVQKNYWAHTSPTGDTAWTFIDASGYQYQQAGENLAYGFSNASETISGWMNSEEHRANMLNNDYTQVGFGVAQAPNFQGKGPQTIIVAEYGQPAGMGFSATVLPSKTNTPQTVTTEVAAQPVSRIEVLTGGQATWSLIALSALAGAAFVFFVTRHGYRLHRAFVKGEYFVVSHPALDIAVVLLFTVGFVLTRTAGLIG